MSVVRVTEVLDYFKEPWYADWLCKVGKREANRIGREAMKVGTRVDEIIKADPFMGVEKIGIKPKEQEVMSCVTAYSKWLEVYKPKSITSGTRLFATIDGIDVTGEPDLFVDDVLMDIKCASKISLKYWIQVNMYRFLQGNNPGKVAILRLDKKIGSYEYVVKDYDPKLVDVWFGMMRAMVYLKGEENDGDEL